ncbi:MAG: PEP/pyruvate-binding domain-containing protein [Candidatus Pacearchaeota archaeon]|jgi:pyruvate,orthophosphate dikinase|nr:PEP-utilizing enzyme [Clostridia bacterium]
MNKLSYFFRTNFSDTAELTAVGRKGFNLLEMNRLNVSLPYGFIVSTDAYAKWKNDKNITSELKQHITNDIKTLESETNKLFGGSSNPLLLSIRSSGVESMPGMMTTILNVGINDDIVNVIAKETGDAIFPLRLYLKFIETFAIHVSGIDEDLFDFCNNNATVEELQTAIAEYKKLYFKEIGEEFPIDVYTQLFRSISAVFNSFNNDVAVYYRKSYGIDDSLGTAVVVQSMVFGNINDNSGTGVLFTRNPITGENLITGEYLTKAQGEDIVSGVVTPKKISKYESAKWATDNFIDETERNKNYISLEESMPIAYSKLISYANKLEQHYGDVQDIEFTIENEIVYILQTRNAKCNILGAVNIAYDMACEGLISPNTALNRIDKTQLHFLNAKRLKVNDIHISTGLSASSGIAVGRIAFNNESVEKFNKSGENSILVRIDTSPADLIGMKLSDGVITTRGGMTCHAAIVARQMNKPCVVGCSNMTIDMKTLTLTINNKVYKEGDFISVDAINGKIYDGKLIVEEFKLTDAYDSLSSYVKLFS